MNPKIEKIDQEIIRITDRIEQLQKRLEILRGKRVELENTAILEMVKSVSATPEQLAVFIKSFKKQGKLDLEAENEVTSHEG